MSQPASPPSAAKPPLMALDDAVRALCAGAQPHAIGDIDTVPTVDALNRVLAAPVVSLLDVPPADNSAMDGYALRSADVPVAGTELPVAQRVPAGVVGAELAPGTAARIFTGAQVPAGADAVVMQELCESLAGDGLVGGLGRVRVLSAPTPGQCVRRRGEDVQRDSVVLVPGQRLTPQALGLAASVGAATLGVRRRPRVALFSTGDELMMPGEPLRPGAIYNGNRFMLCGLLQAAGCTVSDRGIIPDDLAATRAALRAAADGHDLILSTGGVSVGEEDHLRPALHAEGRLALWQIAMKPGKPLAFGAVRRHPDGTDQTADTGETLFIGLPGNPVSSFVTYLLCVSPVLRVLQGLPDQPLRPMRLRADFDWPRPDKRREFLRVRQNASGGLDLFPNQGSGVLTSTVWADGLVDCAPDVPVRKGDLVDYLSLADLVLR